MATRDLQAPFDVAVVMVTVVRPTIVQAVRSIFAQDLQGRIQLLIGIDRWVGERATIEMLRAECPPNVAITLIDTGYSTSQRNGGLYPSHYGGSLKTALSYLANSRHVTYLDDDNWYAPEHLRTLLAAVAGKAWAFALRHIVDKDSGETLCPDTWESVGPGAGVYAKAQGGFVDTNSFLIDALACPDVFPEWAMTRFAGGTGGDRQVLARLAGRAWGTNAAHTVYYRQSLVGYHPYMLWKIRESGVDLARYMPPEAIPGEEVWRQCAAHERANPLPPAPSAPGVSPKADPQPVRLRFY